MTSSLYAKLIIKSRIKDEKARGDGKQVAYLETLLGDINKTEDEAEERNGSEVIR